MIKLQVIMEKNTEFTIATTKKQANKQNKKKETIIGNKLRKKYAKPVWGKPERPSVYLDK